jgi:hypothetical protein
MKRSLLFSATLVVSLIFSFCSFALADDLIPPVPNPMTWAVTPFYWSDGTYYHHSMTATTATDVNPVYYYYDCVSGGGIDSGWIDTPTYTTSPFSTPNIAGYRVCARDSMGNQTEYSAIAYTVPEPATICLFGLAGLFLRRRK